MMSRLKIQDTMRGFKFLSPDGCTYRDSVETQYPLPRPGEQWGPWFPHPQPGEPDGNDCGPGRWHIMKGMSAEYAPTSWWMWFAEGRGILGESSNKFGATEIRLRRISRATFEWLFRRGYMRYSNMRYSNMRGADMRGADMRGANMRGANMSGANMRDSNMSGANMSRANMSGADMRYSDMRGANMSGANMSGADMSRAVYDVETKWPTGFDYVAATQVQR